MSDPITTVPVSGAQADAGSRPLPERLAVLYEQHAAWATRLAFLLTGDGTLAQDLVQDAFARLAGRLVHLRCPEAFPAYLRQTLVNLARAHFRGRRRERTAMESHGRATPFHWEDPDVAGRETVRQALMGLTGRQRAAVVLRYYEDLPDAEIAEILRCRRGTVASLIFRAVRSLREQLGEE